MILTFMSTTPVVNRIICFGQHLCLCHPPVAGVAHRLHNKHGKNVVLLGDGCQALRVDGYAHGIVFSAKELKTDEVFEVRCGACFNLQLKKIKFKMW